MAFTTDVVTKGDLADTLQTTAAALPAFWDGINSRNHAWAYNTIVSALAVRGITPQQAASWDQGADFERDLTLWKNLMQGGATNNIDGKFIESFDRRPELKTTPVTAGGIPITPAGTFGVVGTGQVTTALDDFVADDPDDPRAGGPTRW